MANNSDPAPNHRHDEDPRRPNGTGAAEPWLEAIPDTDGETVTFAPPPVRTEGDRTTAWLTVDAADVVDLSECR